MAKEILCGFGVDVDAVAGWLGFTAARTPPTIFRAGSGHHGRPRCLSQGNTDRAWLVGTTAPAERLDVNTSYDALLNWEINVESTAGCVR